MKNTITLTVRTLDRAPMHGTGGEPVPIMECDPKGVAAKVLEEAAEAYGAWHNLDEVMELSANATLARFAREDLADELADHDNRNFAPENIVPVPDELAIIIQGNAHGRALPYHDRESLEVAISHARLIRARRAAERRLRSL